MHGIICLQMEAMLIKLDFPAHVIDKFEKQKDLANCRVLVNYDIIL